MAELPVLPIKTDALIADTTHMSAEEFGVYVRLLIAMWRHGTRLPDDPKELALIGGVSRRRWFQISERVMRPMTVSGGIVTKKTDSNVVGSAKIARAQSRRSIEKMEKT